MHCIIWVSSFLDQELNQPFPAAGLHLADSAAGRKTTFNISKRSTFMFTRIVECRIRPEQRETANQTLRQQILPLLQKQTGFVDELALISETDPERLVAISFWKSKED